MRLCTIGLAVALGACSNEAGGEAGNPTADQPITRSNADTVVELSLRDFAFDDLPATVQGENILFVATNTGPSEHEFEIIDGHEEAVGEIEAFAPGGQGSLGIRLQPGVYRVQCILTTPAGPSHADLGMTRALRVE